MLVDRRPPRDAGKLVGWIAELIQAEPPVVG
jgi:hypothetical protein